MRYRALTQPNNDFTFGRGSADYLVNSSAAVAQAVLTALKLFQGEWFLDLTAGVPWLTQVAGYGTQAIYDTAIRAAILNVDGVSSIASYSSSLNTKTRSLTVAATINTKFSGGPISFNVQVPIVPTGPTGFGYSPFGQFAFGAQ